MVVDDQAWPVTVIDLIRTMNLVLLGIWLSTQSGILVHQRCVCVLDLSLLPSYRLWSSGLFVATVLFPPLFPIRSSWSRRARTSLDLFVI